MALEKELAYFKRQLPELLKHYKGQQAVIKGERLLGTYTTVQEAFEAAVKELGNEEFLIREVSEVEQIVNFPALSAGLLHVTQ